MVSNFSEFSYILKGNAPELKTLSYVFIFCFVLFDSRTGLAHVYSELTVPGDKCMEPKLT